MEMSKDKFKMDGMGKMSLLVVTLAIFTDILIYTMIVPILPKYATGLGASQQMLGLMFACYAIVFLVATPVVGVISDRVGRKLPMVLGLAGLLLSTLLFAYSDSLAMLVAARSLQGLSAAATWTAGLALLSDIFPAERRQQVLGIALTGSFAGQLIGPGFGGFLFEMGGYALPFLAASVLVAVDGIARIFLLKDPPRHTTVGKTPIRGLLKNRSVLIIAGVITLASAVSGILEPTLPLYLQGRLQTSPGAIGLLFAAATIAGMVCAPFAYKLSERFGRRRVIIAGMVCLALALPVLVLPGSYLLEVAVMALIGGISSVMMSSVPQELTVTIEGMGCTAYGSISAMYNMALSTGMMFGPLAGGILVGYLGMLPGLAIAGAALVVYALVLAFSGGHEAGKKQVAAA